MPAVRMSANGAHATTTATTNAARRIPLSRWRVATAHATRANAKYGVGRKYSIIPCPAPTIDAWATALVANTATTIRTIAPTRSDHGARLNNSHHTAISNAPTTPPSMPISAPPSGASRGAPTMTSNWTMAMATAGHSRSGFGGFMMRVPWD